ncbi:hypothetical protein [Gordonia paraffinivorans]|uniref:hypothetical protein n=1 Tax=Gordonia paraffinivorans TaxID=175628 RepID=UPI00242F0BA1|nr:hypothetical protein [Gordonia paraffinivorans]
MTSPQGNRASRRAAARAQACSSKKLTKAAAALGAVLAIGTGVAAPAMGAELNAGQIAENGYATTDNIITITDNLGRTQIALLAPLKSVLPEGWVPAVTSSKNSTSEPLTILEIVSEATGMLVAVPDTSHVPGVGGNSVLGALDQGNALIQQAYLGLQLADPLFGLTNIAGPAASAGADLTVANGPIIAANAKALAEKAWNGRPIKQQADLIDPTKFLSSLAGVGSGSKTTDSWTGTVDWPALGVSGSNWITQNRLTMDPLTAAGLKDTVLQAYGPLQPLEVAKGSERCTRKALGICYSRTWDAEKDASGATVYEIAYDPNSDLAKALSHFDDFDFQGLSIITREIGSAYSLPLDGSAGSLVGLTQVIIPGGEGRPDQVLTVPIMAGGITSPGQLFTAGGKFSPGIVTNGAQSVQSVLGSRSSSFAIPELGVGLDKTSLLQSYYIGPDGMLINSGVTVALLKLADGVTLPVVYSLGSLNVGPYGIGYSGPSFFGIGLPGFQLGTTPPDADLSLAGVDLGELDPALLDLGQLGSLFGGANSLVSLDPALVFAALGIEVPEFLSEAELPGFLSDLDLPDPIEVVRRIEAFLSPLYTEHVTPTASQISKALADAATNLVNSGSNAVRSASTSLAEATGEIADAVGNSGSASTTSHATGRHALDETSYVGKHRNDDPAPPVPTPAPAQSGSTSTPSEGAGGSTGGGPTSGGVTGSGESASGSTGSTTGGGDGTSSGSTAATGGDTSGSTGSGSTGGSTGTTGGSDSASGTTGSGTSTGGSASGGGTSGGSASSDD